MEKVEHDAIHRAVVQSNAATENEDAQGTAPGMIEMDLVIVPARDSDINHNAARASILRLT